MDMNNSDFFMLSKAMVSTAVQLWLEYWNNCTAASGILRPQATPALVLAHHKTGTYFALAVGGAFCRGRCCVFLNPGDAVWPLKLVARPELVLLAFGHQALLNTSDIQHFRRIVHLVRSPQQVVTSALAYHTAGKENHRLLLTLEEVAASASTWSVVAGIQGTVYCTSETSSLDVVRLVRTGVGLLRRSASKRHAQLLRSLHSEQQLQFEAAWNWCELSNMLRIAESLCAHAHAVQLDVSIGSPPHSTGAAGSILALNLTGLARQLTPAQTGWPKRASYSWVVEARSILQSPLLSAHASNGSLHDGHSVFAGQDEQDRELARVYARLEERYSALRGCTSWRQWRDGDG